MPSSLEDTMQASMELGRLRKCDCGNSQVQGRRLPGGAPRYQVRCAGCGVKTAPQATAGSVLAAWNQKDLEASGAAQDEPDPLSEESRAEIRQLLEKWEEARTEEDDAASRASAAEEELRGHGVDPTSPPNWYTSDEEPDDASD